MEIIDVRNWDLLWKNVRLMLLLLSPLFIVVLKNLAVKICNKIADIKWAQNRTLNALPLKEKTDEWQAKVSKNSKIYNKCRDVKDFIREYFEIDNPLDHPLTILYFLFWVGGALICTVLAFILAPMVFPDFMCTPYEVKEVELKYEVFMSNPDPNERFLMKAEDFNVFLEKERNKPNKLKWVKPEVREDILTRCIVDENAIRKMVFAKYKNLDDFFNGLMEMEVIHGQ